MSSLYISSPDRHGRSSSVFIRSTLLLPKAGIERVESCWRVEASLALLLVMTEELVLLAMEPLRLEALSN